MRAFSCFITDSRHAVPTLSFIFASDVWRAQELARRELLESPHALSFELCEDGRLVAVGERRHPEPKPASPPRAREPRSRLRVALSAAV